MKIGVFGDSFADKNGAPLELKGIRNFGLPWFDVLKEKYDTVTSFGTGGSSLYYSYLQLLEHGDNFDVNVLCVTAIGRPWLNSDFTKEHKLDGQIFGNVNLSGAHQLPIVKNNVNNYKGKDAALKKHQAMRVVDAVQSREMYLKDSIEEDIFHTLMLNDLKNRFPNLILMPCFLESFGRKNMNFYSQALSVPSDNELRAKDFDKKYPNGFGNIYKKNYFLTDLRACHFSKENNIVLANIVSNAIDAGVRGNLILDYTKFVIPKEPLEYYLGITNGIEIEPMPIPS